MIKVSVPATSANIGVGYDCMGLALDMMAYAEFEIISNGFEIIGCAPAYCGEDNLFYQAFMKALDYMDEHVSGVRIRVHSEVPYTRGLGSSATCIVAGLAGANALMGNRMNKYEIFDLATQMEGHPDNVAPAVFGGLCVSFMEDGKPHMIRYGIHPELRFVTMIPDYEVSTKEARAVLPNKMSYQDAIYQMGRCASLAKAFEINNAMVMRKACTDKMHEPYRKTLIPEYDHVKQLVDTSGAVTMFISGSGSTMIAIAQGDEQAKIIAQCVKEQYPIWDIRILHAIYEGVQCEVK